MSIHCMESNWRLKKFLISKGEKLCILACEMSIGVVTYFRIMWRWKLLVLGLGVSIEEKSWWTNWNVNVQGHAMFWFSKGEKHT
jgi:hypothetical protein